MKTIYLIGFTSNGKLILPCDISTDYATDEEGIKRLALDWYWTGWEKEKIPVHVNLDMDHMEVSIYDKADIDLSITYDILAFDRRVTA